MNEFFQTLVENVVAYLPTALVAIGVLIGGWLLAVIITSIVRGALRRSGLDTRLGKIVATDPQAEGIDIAGWVSRVVYYLLMLFVVVAFLQTLNLTVVADPIRQLLNQVLAYLPVIFGAGALLLVAWIVATAARIILLRVLNAVKFDERVASQAALDTDDRSFNSSIANFVYWLVLLLFLPAVLGALGLQGLLVPVQGIVDDILGVLPNILGAALILFAGWIGARILRSILANVLIGLGIDRVGERTGVAAAFGGQKLSSILSTVVYVLILIPIFISALNALEMEAVSAPASQMLGNLLNAFPAIFGAIVLLAAAYFVAQWLSNFVTGVLSGIGFDRVLSYVGLGAVETATTPSQIVGYLTSIALMLFAVIEAANLLGFTFVAGLVSEFLVAAGGVLLAIVIFGLGLYFASLAERVIRDTGVAQANLLAPAARIAVIVFSAGLALRETGIAEDIVNLTFSFVLGTVAVAAALAFGLGSRDIAGRELENWLKSLRGK
jgi:hypothetical protein